MFEMYPRQGLKPGPFDGISCRALGAGLVPARPEGNHKGRPYNACDKPSWLRRAGLIASVAVLIPIFTISAAADSTSSPTNPLAQHPAVTGAIELLELWIEEQRAYLDLPGLSVAVVKNQEVIWARGFGLADRASEVPATAETLYRMGSITKLFTATAVLQLRDQGKLRLDDPVARYLPWFRVDSDFGDWPPITLRHLLTHTSGLPREAAFPYWTTHEFPSVEEIAGALPKQKAIYPPGTRYKYSNLGMALLGAVVEAVSEQPYADYLREHVFEPLGMADTTALPTEDHHQRRATSYMRRMADGRREIFDYYDTGGIAPAANLVSSVRDLAKFAALQFSEEPSSSVLRRSTVLEMHRPHWVYDSWGGGRGLGYSISRKGGETFVSHGGWIGGNRSHLLLQPAAKLAILAITNADDGSPGFFTSRIYDVLAPAVDKATAQSPPEPRKDPAWHRYVGRYTDPWHWEYQVRILDGQLVMYGHNYPPDGNPEGGVDRLVPVAEHTFRLGDGELVVFELDEQGKVERIRRRYEILLPTATDP